MLQFKYLGLIILGIIFIGILTCNNSDAQTTISGGNVSGLWTLSESPYNIENNVTIPTDSILVIEPGVVVNFMNLRRMYVEGAVVAVGTVNDTIVFTANSGSWKGIHYYNTSSTQDTSFFAYCKMTRSSSSTGGAIRFLNFSKSQISHCLFVGNSSSSGGAINCFNSSIMLEYCTIRNNTSNKGGGVYLENSSTIIKNCRITDNECVGVTPRYGGGVFISDGNPTISESLISNNVIGAGYGGGIYCESTNINLTTDTIANNSSTSSLFGPSYGGGIYCGNSNVNITQCHILGNTANGTDDNLSAYSAGKGGGIMSESSVISVQESSISENYASSNGGGICCDSTFTISGNLVNGNTAFYGYGGGIYSGSSVSNSSTISDNSVNYNTAVFGAGICSVNSSPTILNDTIMYNIGSTAGYGVTGIGIYCNGFHSEISNNVISNNTGAHGHTAGGGIACINSDVSVNDNMITNNEISSSSGYNCYGGGLYLENSTLDINNNQIVANHASGINAKGGGVFSSGPSVFLTDNTIIANSAQSKGGGIYCFGDFKIVNSDVSHNTAGGGIYFERHGSNFTSSIENTDVTYNTGNGIYCDTDEKLKIVNSRISNNAGSGIYCSGSPIVMNTIISNNQSQSGGAIYIEPSTSPIFINATIVNNRSTLHGGGLYIATFSNYDSPSFINCMIWGNESEIESGNIYMLGSGRRSKFSYCNIENGANGILEYSGGSQYDFSTYFLDNLNVSPQFITPSSGSGTSFDGYLADWRVQANSLCIDAGTPDTSGLGLVYNDIDGGVRIIGNAVDIGAHEHQDITTGLVQHVSEVSDRFTIYPNPSPGKLTWESKKPGILRLQIIDVHGKMVYEHSFSGAVSSISIDLTFLSDGTYLIQQVNNLGLFESQPLIIIR